MWFFKYTYAGQEVASYWYSTVRRYNYFKDIRLLHTNVNAGHFTQMVWMKTKYFGIGKATSKSGKIFVVAYYYPAGEFIITIVAHIVAYSLSSIDKRFKSGFLLLILLKMVEYFCWRHPYSKMFYSIDWFKLNWLQVLVKISVKPPLDLIIMKPILEHILQCSFNFIIDLMIERYLENELKANWVEYA